MKYASILLTWLASVLVGSAANADSNINTATASGRTQAEACNSAMSSAAIPAYGQNITEKKCECKEENPSEFLKWSCVGFVSYNIKDNSTAPRVPRH